MWVRKESGVTPMFTADRGTAPLRKGMKSFCKVGSEGLKGCVGGGSHLYGQTSVYIRSVSLQDEIQSHGIDKR